MNKEVFDARLKELKEHLVSQGDERGLSLLNKALDMLHPRGLSDVTEEELMGFLTSIEHVEGSDSTQEWVSISAVRTDVGLVTRGMIESEINRRSAEQQ
jgi:hypothetical protein